MKNITLILLKSFEMYILSGVQRLQEIGSDK